MKSLRPVPAFLAATATGGLALASAFTFGTVLRSEAARVSHRQPTPETWWESPAPTSPALVARGRSLFLANCAHCHGVDARGDEGPDLHSVPVSDRYIGHVIANGFPHEMPSFRKKFGAAETGALTAYIRTLE